MSAALVPVAITCAVALLGWLVATEWLPMFPLNDLRGIGVKERLQAGAANYPFQVLVAFFVILQEQWSFTVAALLAGAQLVSHLVQWWLPYVGLSTRARRAGYRRQFSHTVKLLPTAGHDVVPDVQHMVVGVLSLALSGTTLALALGA